MSGSDYCSDGYDRADHYSGRYSRDATESYSHRAMRQQREGAEDNTDLIQHFGCIYKPSSQGMVERAINLLR